MKNSFGQSVILTLSGESHGPALTAILDGLAPGIPVDMTYIREQLTLRRPVGALSTARQEEDPIEILSGVFAGHTTGTPITLLIRNADTRSKDYDALAETARPGHADYTAQCKYHGFQDYRGGGHFSGRVTAALVAAGAIARQALTAKSITIGTHIAACAGIQDRRFDRLPEELEVLNRLPFAVIDPAAGEAMQQAIRAARSDGDSVGGVLETAVTGLPAGVGEPFFDSVESVLSHALFSIPGVKGVAFGDGFSLAGMRGSEANDAFCLADGRITTVTNHNGGVNGGITNGAPLLFSCAIKPTPSIAKAQSTVNFATPAETTLTITGRHDPAIVHRARAVVDNLTALVLCDLLAGRFGTDYLGGVR